MLGGYLILLDPLQEYLQTRWPVRIPRGAFEKFGLLDLNLRVQESEHQRRNTQESMSLKSDPEIMIL